MARAIQLARKGLYTSHPNPRVGCVLVKAGSIIGEGWHLARGGAHAEVNALKQARAAELVGADCYLTLEPCSHTGYTPPCAEALLRAEVGRVLMAMLDPYPQVAGRGLDSLKNAGVRTEVGLLAEESKKLNPGFIKRMTEGMPYVRCKLAMSMDGRTAAANGESQWITTPEARADVQKLRAQSSALMTGIGTVLMDDPQLNVRVMAGCDTQPLRVILDRQLRCPASARILRSPGQVLIYTNSEKPEKEALAATGAEVVILDAEEDAFLPAVMRHLAKEKEVNEVLVESGAQLAGSMLDQGLIDEMVLYQAPVLLGDKGKGLFHLPVLQGMSDKIQLHILDRRMIGKDLRITARISSTLSSCSQA